MARKLQTKRGKTNIQCTKTLKRFTRSVNYNPKHNKKGKLVMKYYL